MQKGVKVKWLAIQRTTGHIDKLIDLKCVLGKTTIADNAKIYMIECVCRQEIDGSRYRL